MTHAELKARIESGLPFTLHVADGRSFEVPHRDFIFLAPKSSIVVVATPNPDNGNETVTDTIPLLLVSGFTQKSPSHRVAEDCLAGEQSAEEKHEFPERLSRRLRPTGRCRAWPDRRRVSGRTRAKGGAKRPR